jgi:hypothetical protein
MHGAEGFMSSISERIKFLLSKGRNSGIWLRLSTSPQTVNNWIKRDALSREAAQQISEKFGYSLDWLLMEMALQRKIRRAISRQSLSGELSMPGTKTHRYLLTRLKCRFFKDIEFACGDGRVQCEDHNGFKLRFSKSTLRRVGANIDGSGVLCWPQVTAWSRSFPMALR